MSDLEHSAIERFKVASEMSLHHYGLPLVITDSGGKDSAVIKELARRAGIPFEVIHNHTTADAPETVRFIRSEAKRFEDMGIKYTINMPMYKGKRTSMWSLIPQKLMPPTRLVRYCCSVLKETGGAGKFIATGVRWAESASRKNGRGIYEKNGDKDHRIILNNDNDVRRMLFENCRLKAKRTVNPIIDWTDDDVFDVNAYSAEKFYLAHVKYVNDMSSLFIEDSKSDPECVFSKTDIDRRLLQIVGEDNFAPWDERYGGKDG